MTSVMVLQTLSNLSDREAAEALTYDLRWKAARGFALMETSFHPTVLVYWCKRLAASDQPHRIFKAVTAVIAQSGALSGRRRRALDATILEDAVALLSSINTHILNKNQQETVALLALIAGQDVKPAEDSEGTDGRWRIAQRVAPDRVISTVDPDAAHGHQGPSNRTRRRSSSLSRPHTAPRWSKRRL
jgi:hypothetical protein